MLYQTLSRDHSDEKGTDHHYTSGDSNTGEARFLSWTGVPLANKCSGSSSGSSTVGIGEYRSLAALRAPHSNRCQDTTQHKQRQYALADEAVRVYTSVRVAPNLSSAPGLSCSPPAPSPAPSPAGTCRPESDHPISLAPPSLAAKREEFGGI